ncbi:heavy-metal-associated domain-containing protein [Patescibacteria group bacterium]|nr:heavy-metal-associated domain-containing protein [Patescibacteria group bacterium]
MKQTIKFGGLTCGACQKVIQKRISKIPGVEDVAVEGDGNTQISASNLLSKSEVEKALEGTPYKLLEI